MNSSKKNLENGTVLHENDSIVLIKTPKGLEDELYPGATYLIDEVLPEESGVSVFIKFGPKEHTTKLGPDEYAPYVPFVDTFE